MPDGNAANVTGIEAESSANAWKGNAAVILTVTVTASVKLNVNVSTASMCGMNAANVMVIADMNIASALKGNTAKDKECL